MAWIDLHRGVLEAFAEAAHQSRKWLPAELRMGFTITKPDEQLAAHAERQRGYRAAPKHLAKERERNRARNEQRRDYQREYMRAMRARQSSSVPHVAT